MQNTPLLRHQIVRNLASSCFGPSLIDNFAPFQNCDVQCGQFELNQRRRDWLLSLDRDPSPLLEHIKQLKSTRLGIYFEALWLFFLQQDPDFEVIANNLLVYKERRTLGEFDLIYRDKARDQVIHLELALKYYLSNPDNQAPYPADAWLGPNNTDRLDLKVKRLLEHQACLSETPQGASLLADMGIKAIEKQVVIKGRLFYYAPVLDNMPDSIFNNVQPPAVDSSYLAPQHNAAQWCYYPANRAVIEQLPCCTILDRLDWLSSIDMLDDQTQAVTGAQLITLLDSHFAQYDRPIKIATLTNNGSEIREEKRFFLVAGHWPLAKPNLATFICSK